MRTAKTMDEGTEAAAGPDGFNRAMEALFHPKRIAIVGATPRPGFANGIHNNLLRNGYEGEIIPINPKYDEVLGSKAYPTVDAVPGGVEHVIIVVPSHLVLDILEQCERAGTRAVNIITSGFGEQSDDLAHERQEQLREFSRRTGIRIVGPNCLGIISRPNKMVAKTGAYEEVLPGPVGIVFQSGLLGFSIGIPARHRGIGFTYIVTTGNEADLEAADYIHYMVEDEQTRVIGCFIEQFRDPEKLLDVARLAAERQKPIVVLKVGRSAGAQRAAQAHTGSLVGSDAVVDAIMRQHGLIRVNSLEEMTETLAAFHTRRLPAGPGVGTIFVSGGAGGLVSDLSADLGISLPELAPETTEKLSKVIPEYGTVGNPLDTTGQAATQPEITEGSLVGMAEDPNIHTIVYGQAFPSMMDLDTPVGQVFKSVSERYPDKVFYVSSLVTGQVHSGARFGREPVEPVMTLDGIPFLQGTENTLRAVRSVNRYAEFLRNRESDELVPARPGENASKAREIVQATGGKPMTERAAKDLLALYGIPVTRERLARTADEAAEAAQEIGYPVVMKIESPDITHKTDAGGVLLNIADDLTARNGFERIMAGARRYDASAELTGVLVQEMAPKGRELIVGMTQDPDFGPAVAVGLGGIFVELLKDVQLGVPPLSERTRRAMLSRLRGATILDGTRGQGPADVEAVIELLGRFSQLCTDLRDEVSEIDINPLLVFDAGQGAKVVDCLIVPFSAGSEGNQH